MRCLCEQCVRDNGNSSFVGVGAHSILYTNTHTHIYISNLSIILCVHKVQHNILTVYYWIIYVFYTFKPGFIYPKAILDNFKTLLQNTVLKTLLHIFYTAQQKKKKHRKRCEPSDVYNHSTIRTYYTYPLIKTTTVSCVSYLIFFSVYYVQLL